MSRFAGYSLAVLLHAAILLFGGLLFMRDTEEEKKTVVEAVDLVTEDEEEKKKDPAEKDEKAAEETDEKDEPEEALETPNEMPDLHELTEEPAAAAPALEALSLAALEGALDPGASSAGEQGFFGGGGELTSGGVIGGTGKAGAASAELDSIFSLAELDQKPRVVFQAAPSYPFELRRRKVEGTVMVFFVVDPQGRVVSPKVESSPNPEFERAALDAIRQWRFEPAVKDGQKVSCKMRAPLRFSAS